MNSIREAYEYHRAQAAAFAERAANARRNSADATKQRRHLEAFKLSQTAAEMRATRDYHKAEAKQRREMMKAAV